MLEQGKKKLKAIKIRWQAFRLIRLLMFAFGISAIITSILVRYTSVSWESMLLVFPVSALCMVAIFKLWKVSDQTLCRQLNFHHRSLEDSTGLLLKPSTELGFLQQLQQEKITSALFKIEKPLNFFPTLKPAFLLLLSGLFVAFGIQFLPKDNGNIEQTSQQQITLSNQLTSHPEVAKVAQSIIRVSPPRYTGLPSTRQETFDLHVPQGSMVSWELHTSIPAEQVAIIFNNQDTLSLNNEGQDRKKWVNFRRFNHSGFYQVLLDDQLSDLYPLTVKEDHPAEILIETPVQHSYIDYGQPPLVDLKLTAKDDYGIKNAHIQATIAMGKGESVSFSEQKMNFEQNFSKTAKEYALAYQFDLKKLGLIPGDEMYFFVSVEDNFDQESRSDVYYITMADTAELLSIDGMMSGVDLVPEYFRSERQIIIDTEKLLDEKDTISQKEFETRSNNLGIDQKLLRLRYGKFLGEESETNIGDSRVSEDGGEEGHEEEHEEHQDQDFSQSGFGDPEVAMDAYAHKHDIAEDATFFDPELKGQLKATLTEMWNAELKLRTFYPEEALPFAYKALRLLKDLQQKSRSYVAKTAVKTPPLKPEKRLSGELDKISGAESQYDKEESKTDLETLQASLTILEALRQGNLPTAEQQQVITKTQSILNQQAVESPQIFLPALQTLNEWVTAKFDSLPVAKINLIEKSVAGLVNQVNPAPTPARVPVGGDLAKNYYELLNQIPAQ